MSYLLDHLHAACYPAEHAQAVAADNHGTNMQSTDNRAQRIINAAYQRAESPMHHIGLLQGEIRLLCNSLDEYTAKISPTLEYADVRIDDLRAFMTIGFNYSPWRPGSEYEPAEPEEIELIEFWLNGVDIGPLMPADAVTRIADSLLTTIRARLP